MAAKLTERELTDYALNELEPNERLYVESMLAVSEEGRNDVYATIDLALMLEETFEREDERAAAELTLDQRRTLVHLPVPNRFLRRAVAGLAAAACVTFAFATQHLWLPKGSVDRVARASRGVSDYMDAVASPGGDDFLTQLAKFRKLIEDPSVNKWLRSQPASGPSTWSQPVGGDATPHASLEFMP